MLCQCRERFHLLPLGGIFSLPESKGKKVSSSLKDWRGSVLSNISFPPFTIRASLFPPLFKNRNDSMSDHRINSMSVGETVGLRTNKTVQQEIGRNITDTHDCSGISDVWLEEEIIHMVWLGRMQSGEQRHSSSWKKESSWGSCQGHYDQELLSNTTFPRHDAS